MQGLLSFLQNELLGMKWLDRLMARLVAAAGLNPEGRLGGSIRFFLYDTIKILVLLGCLILIISYIQSYSPRSAPAPLSRCLWALPGRGCRWGSPFRF